MIVDFSKVLFEMPPPISTTKSLKNPQKVRFDYPPPPHFNWQFLKQEAVLFYETLRYVVEVPGKPPLFFDFAAPLLNHLFCTSYYYHFAIHIHIDIY